MPNEFRFKPLTPDLWDDFVDLFGDKGACGGCWCMNMRLRSKDFEKHKGADNKRLMKKLVNGVTETGIIAYYGTTPIGWCSIGPSEDFVRFETARTIKPTGEEPVWSIVCLFIAKEYRRKGVSSKLIEAAVQYAKKNKAKLIEAYPHDLNKPAELLPDPFVYTGLRSSYEKAGFHIDRRPSKSRVIMQRKL